MGRPGGELLSTAGTPPEGFDQGMQRREGSAYWERDGLRKPSSGVPWPHHDSRRPPGLSTRPHTHWVRQSPIILTPQTATHIIKQSTADALGLQLSGLHVILKI